MAPVKRSAEPSSLVKGSKRIKSSPSRDPRQRKQPLDEPFRRGGADILTPLEQRQIRTQARQDALLEQSTSLRIDEIFHSKDDEDHAASTSELSPAKTIAKRRQLGTRVTVPKAERAKLQPRIERLSYKRMNPGVVVLGQVVQVGHQDITIALPNNLVGYVPARSISDEVDRKLNLLDDDCSGQCEDTEAGASSPLDLADYVTVGQYLRAMVTSISSGVSSSLSARKRIELTINPKNVNLGLIPENITPNSVLQAEVISAEDHGLILSTGLADPGVRGFMSRKDLGPTLSLAEARPGKIILCLVADIISSGKTIKLSANPERLGNYEKNALPKNTTTIESLLPGAVIEFSLSSSSRHGLCGKVMDVIDVTADVFHSGQLLKSSFRSQDLSIGSKVKARIIWVSAGAEEERAIGVSILPHVLTLSRLSSSGLEPGELPTDILPISSIKDNFRVERIEPDIGLLLDVDVPTVYGFAHISRLSEKKIQSISETSGAFCVGSLHRGRVVGYNPIDGLFQLSLEPSILKLPFLSLDDIQPGIKVNGTVERLLTHSQDITGMLIRLTDSVTGFVQETHFADVALQLPERKFKLGSEVMARVLSVDLVKRQLRLTCKKSLINDTTAVWKSYSELQLGLTSLGTIISLNTSGAILEFYGHVKGFLPISEMSESYVQDPTQHFRVGQVLSVSIIALNKVRDRMTLSCRAQPHPAAADTHSLGNHSVGDKVIGQVIDLIGDEIALEIKESGARAKLRSGHLLDASYRKCLMASQRLRIGQTLQKLVVIGRSKNRKYLMLTSKPSLTEALGAETMPRSFEDINVGTDVVGFVNNITTTGVFVEFAEALTGLLLTSQIPDDQTKLPNFGMHKDQTVLARVLAVDPDQRRFLLTQKVNDVGHVTKRKLIQSSFNHQELAHPVDGVSQSLDDFTLGKSTAARITSVKETQLNVELADGVRGRIDVSQVFDSWEDIKDRKRPLASFKAGQTLPVRILGIHDSKTHRFLPITHSRTVPVFELSAKSGVEILEELKLLTLDQVQAGSTCLCYVNNIARDHLWVNVTPNIRGRIHAFNVSDDPNVPTDLPKHFPVGSAIKATVLHVDVTKNRLDLSAKSGSTATSKDITEFHKGDIVPGKVISVTSTLIKIQLSELASGFLPLTDIADDFSKIDLQLFKENQIVTVCVTDFGEDKGRLYLSTRPSKILNMEAPVVDPEITSLSQLHVNDTMRGFIRNVTDQGIFIGLSRSITAFVRVTDLSDDFLKSWRERFEKGKLVRGKIISIDDSLGHVRMSLKDSVILGGYRVPIAWADLCEGQVYSGKVRKAEQFGIFVVFDNSTNVSGLCHRSELADEPIVDARQLYGEGDAVTVKILKIDHDARRVSLTMKSSVLRRMTSPPGPQRSDSQEAYRQDASGDDSDTALDLKGDLEPSLEQELEPKSEMIRFTKGGPSENIVHGLDTELEVERFSWSTAAGLIGENGDTALTSLKLSRGMIGKEPNAMTSMVDKTAELDSEEAQSVSDFERLLLGQPESSFIWLKYMSFHVQMNELQKARDVAERAIRTIALHGDAEDEGMNVWVAFLNLEHTYGDDETLAKLLKRSCQHKDPKEMHRHLVTIFIQSGAYEKADELLKTMVQKFSDEPLVWINYASFLFNVLEAPSRGRELLSRALLSLSEVHHIGITSKFAQLEFKSIQGDNERGRTMFEGLLSNFPHRLDLWIVLIDLEIKSGSVAGVRKLFERVTSKKLKPRKARAFFKKWLLFEEKSGNQLNVASVKGKAESYEGMVKLRP